MTEIVDLVGIVFTVRPTEPQRKPVAPILRSAATRCETSVWALSGPLGARQLSTWYGGGKRWKPHDAPATIAFSYLVFRLGVVMHTEMAVLASLVYFFRGSPVRMVLATRKPTL